MNKRYFDKGKILKFIILGLVITVAIETSLLLNRSQLDSNTQTTIRPLSASDEIAWKLKCNQIGEDYLKVLQEKWPPPESQYYASLVAVPDNPEFAYNSSINTCLINYTLAGSGTPVFGPQSSKDMSDLNSAFNKTGVRVQHHIDNTLTHVSVAEWDDESGVIPPRKTYGTFLDWNTRVQDLMVNNLK